MRKEATIKIQLKSDLCMGSGYSYAGIIDSDICYDAYGIPYIPAKRLKGCFRDVAENTLYSIIDQEKIEKIFGKAGSHAAPSVFWGNAYIENYDSIRKELNKFRTESKNAISQQDVLNMFTHIKAQTKLENGVAKDTALRYTRVTNQYSPMKRSEKGELVLEASVMYDAEDEETLKQIIHATRNIGLHRNRGLGSVRCEFPIGCHDAGIGGQFCGLENDAMTENNDSPADGEALVVLSYVLENVQPLMLSGNSDTESDKYISGKSMLGFFAGRYLATDGASAEDVEFRDLFLRGKTKFTNAVPCKYVEDDKVQSYYPAPEYINKLKKSKKLVNTFFDYTGEEKEYNPENGNIPKKLKNKFVAFENGNVDVTDVDMQIIYHHSEKAKSEDDENGQLFGLTAVKENQFFSGAIYVSEKYAGHLEKFLTNDPITLGKSRSSQYGKCECRWLQKGKNAGVQSFCKGDTIVVTLLSDAIFMNDRAEYTVYSDEIKQIAAESFCIPYESDNTYSDRIQTKELVGYQTQWNLRKAPVPAVKAGSCFVYKLAEDFNTNRNFVGERNLEGYGQVRIDSLNDMKYIVDVDEIDVTEGARKISPLEQSKELVRDILVEKIVDKLKLDGISQKTYKVTASGLGRVTLMLKESLSANKTDIKKAFQEFANRVESIKSDSLKREIRNVILDKFGSKEADAGSPFECKWTFHGFDRLEENSQCKTEWQTLRDIGYEEQEIKTCVDARWGDILETILISQKYGMKGEK